METKLTLKLDKAVIGRAKSYAKRRKTSLSNLVENYLEHITSPESGDEEISPLVKKLSGIIHLSPGYDYKKKYRAHLKKKYRR